MMARATRPQSGTEGEWCSSWGSVPHSHGQERPWDYEMKLGDSSLVITFQCDISVRRGMALVAVHLSERLMGDSNNKYHRPVMLMGNGSSKNANRPSNGRGG